MRIFRFVSISGMDFKTMPPCRPVLINKVKRANYISQMIKTCHKNLIPLDFPDLHGWVLSDNQFVIEYFNGLRFPDSIADEDKAREIEENEDSDMSDEEEYNLDFDKSDIIFSDTDDDFDLQ